jgi:hypothetical protein
MARPNRSGKDWKDPENRRQCWREWKSRQGKSERVEASIGAVVRRPPTADEVHEDTISYYLSKGQIRLVAKREEGGY